MMDTSYETVIKKKIEPCERNLCTGCGACAASCPLQAIEMTCDKNGFTFPEIKESVCINCGKCRSVCSVLSPILGSSFQPSEINACWHINPVVRHASSSGGLFSLFAEKILEQGGTVYGAVYDEKLNCVIRRGTSLDDLAQMRGSKYLQADSSHLFHDVTEDLKKGKPILVSGTPCQNAALRSFLAAHLNLSEEPDSVRFPKNLFFVDFLCHGVASPALWISFLKAIETKYQKKISNVRFRDKDLGGWKSPAMKFQFQDGTECSIPWSTPLLKLENSYIISYHKNLALRSSCLHCRWTGKTRFSDLTIADARALYHHPQFTDQTREGISLLLINTEQGKRLYLETADQMKTITRPYEESGLPGRPASPHPLRESFLSDAAKLDYPQLYRKYHSILAPKFRLETFTVAVMRVLLGPKIVMALREKAAYLSALLKRFRK